MGRFFRFFLVLFILPLSALSGQNTASPQFQNRTAGPSVPPPGGTDRQITLDVQVTDKSGTPIRGLQQQDFTLLYDKQPQSILSFHEVNGAAASTTDPPVEIVLVVDAVNASPKPSLTNENKSSSFCYRMAASSRTQCRLSSLQTLERRSRTDPLAMEMLWRHSTTNSKPGYNPSIGLKASMARRSDLTSHSRPLPHLRRTR